MLSGKITNKTKPAAAINAAKIAGDIDHGNDLAVGTLANLAFIDPAVKREIVRSTESKSENNPYAGLTLPGRVMHTLYRGTLTVQNGTIRERL